MLTAAAAPAPELTPRYEYDFSGMEIGDTKSFEVPSDDPKAGSKTLCAAYAYARRHGWKLVGRLERKDGKVFRHIYRMK
jgi:hypothetical protein